MLSKLTVSVMKNRFAFWLLGAGAALTLLAGPAHAAQEFRLSLKGLQVAAPGSPSQGGATPPEPVLAPGALSASTVAFGDVVLDSTVLRTAVVSNSGQSSLGNWTSSGLSWGEVSITRSSSQPPTDVKAKGKGERA